ncbi:hypothetical protein [Streptomyces glaucescens]|uniref:Uncharacterized protein n=1 Tax=Streptomyces glaucescens TaxID=1907 RepID=A0A089XFG7_STRGA|nr:hypothetical protein [Streptomyces glaucescens]AIS02034.1 hypothetical protein SGLAU_30500 [Streptomyces glaucescens]
MAHTIDELVELQRAADAAQAELQRVQKAFGRPTEGRWAAEQHTEWETAFRAWSDLSRQVQLAITEHAESEGTSRGELEAEVQRRARQPEQDGPGGE